MIPFFRRLRKQLADDNKPLKYLRYAIGEIVLVVTGILIAVKINNWNQLKENQATLKQYLIEFREELNRNINAFSNDLEDIAIQKEQKDKLLKNKHLDTVPLNILEEHIETWYIDVSFNPVILKRFENSQITNYGKYTSIFNNLQEFYGYLMTGFEEDKRQHNNAVDKEDEFWRYQQNTYELKYLNDDTTFVQDSTERKQALIKLIQSPIVRNILKTDYRRKETNRRRIEFVKNKAEFILNQINDVLND